MHSVISLPDATVSIHTSARDQLNNHLQNNKFDPYDQIPRGQAYVAKTQHSLKIAIAEHRSIVCMMAQLAGP